jgi:thiosulfate/3-mercaptopyruvate sulfurtransferase
MNSLSTTQMKNLIGDPKVTLLDIRPIDAYNGWRLNNEPRGGHIPSAKSLPAKWTSYVDWLDIVRSKGIQPDDSLVMYGYTDDETERIARVFLRVGYTNLTFYNHFANEWSANERLPLSRLQRYRQLVPPQWLHTLIFNGTAPEYENDSYIICHAHYQNGEDYDKGHIPGAIELDTNTLESPDTWNRRPSHELKAALEQAGITRDTTVILYGRCSPIDSNDPFPGSSAGHIAAMRCAFIMLYAGVKDVRILNGGLRSWIDAGYQLTQNSTPRRPAADFGAPIPQCPELAVDMAEAKEILRSPNKNLVCVRSWREYIGEVSGYNYIQKRGRIPGAVFGNCGSDAYHMENYRNVDFTTREYHEIEKIWAEAGIVPEKHNSFYCGTGWRGSEAFINAWLMGWPSISVFDGGWFEWSNDENNPFETGVPGSLRPLGHHWQDATHITFGVFTAGLIVSRLKLDASIFTGREPDDNRWNLDRPRFDSYSGRVSYRVLPALKAQISAAYLQSPEQLHPEINQVRMTWSIETSYPILHKNTVSSSLVFGANIESGQESSDLTNTVLAEFEVALNRWIPYGRYEFSQKKSRDLGIPQEAEQKFDINALTLGSAIRIADFLSLSFFAGAQGIMDIPDRNLKIEYGGLPLSWEIYLRIRPSGIGQ